MDEADLKSVIEELVRAAWAQKMPVLLSELGAHNGGEVARKARKISGGLSMYLAQNLTDDFNVIKHSKNPVVIGVVPRNAETEKITDFDPVLEQRLSQPGDKNIQFGKSFWAAFRKKLEPEKRRYMEIEGYNRFKNLPSEADPPEGMIEIPREYIAAEDEVSDTDIYQNIEKWAQANKFSLEIFSTRELMSLRRVKYSQLPEGATTLDRLLGALDTSDLKRIEMPLDIIQKLSRSKL